MSDDKAVQLAERQAELLETISAQLTDLDSATRTNRVVLEKILKVLEQR